MYFDNLSGDIFSCLILNTLTTSKNNTNSSFDEYSSELQSMRLDWSPVHKSDKFWKENAVRLNEKNYFLLK